MSTLTKIRRVPVKRYYRKILRPDPQTGMDIADYKRRYDNYRYDLTFPKDFKVEDLVGRELTFQRNGDAVLIRPKDDLG